jgi:quercetin dioxygenase-like cupin family protein
MTEKGLRIFRGDDAPSLGPDMMSPPHLDPSIPAALDLSPLAASGPVDVLFRGDGPSGFSLVRARFNPGYRLPRHSHSADCLYYVVAGRAVMGSQVLHPGDGFFVAADAPYAYEAGPDGVEVLEFRATTNFDIQVKDQTVERWKPLVDAAVANQAEWRARNATR